MFRGYFSCFINTFYKQIKSWSLYTSWQDICDLEKVVIDRVRQVVILCSVNTAKYYLGGLASSCYGEVVVLERWSLRQVRLHNVPKGSDTVKKILQHLLQVCLTILGKLCIKGFNPFMTEVLIKKKPAH